MNLIVIVLLIGTAIFMHLQDEFAKKENCPVPI